MLWWYWDTEACSQASLLDGGAGTWQARTSLPTLPCGSDRDSSPQVVARATSSRDQVCLCYHVSALDMVGVQTGVPTPQCALLGHSRHVNGCAYPAIWWPWDISDIHKVCSCQPMAFLGHGRHQHRHACAAMRLCWNSCEHVCMLPMHCCSDAEGVGPAPSFGGTRT